MLFNGKLIDRRSFLASAGACFVHGLSAQRSLAVEKTDAILASAYRTDSGKFGIALLSENGALIHKYQLPSRGHDIVFRPRSHELVAFARRPGTFAAIVDQSKKQAVHLINAPAGRHYYGHGCFSSDGNFLFATENDFDNERGVVGIYDARSDYERVGEFESYGIGPHEMVLAPDRRTLVIANGGIVTHPDFPRTKLNIATMRPNLCFVDVKSGGLITKIELDSSMHKLSIRHLAILGDNVWFACQNEGDPSSISPLIGSVSLSNGDHTMLDMPTDQLMRLRGYVGSIASNVQLSQIAFTSPRGGVAFAVDAKSSEVISVIEQEDICGVTSKGSDFVTTSGTGQLGRATSAHHSALHWDNHIAGARA